MSKTARALSFASLAVMSAAPLALAAGGEGEHGAHETLQALPSPNQGLVTGITAIVVFIIVLAIMATQIWPKISKGLADRAAKIRQEIQAAEDARRQAKEALEQYQQSLQQARAEAARMLESTKAQQQALAAELKAKADAELSQMRERAMKDIESAKRAALSEIYAESASLSSLMASKILRREIRPDDQRGLIEESLGQMASMRN